MTIARILTLAPTLAAFLVIAWSRDLSQLSASFNLGALLILTLLTPPLLALLLAATGREETTTALRKSLQKLLAHLPLAFLVLTTALAAGTFNLFDIALQQANRIHYWLAFHDPFNLFAFLASILAVHGTLRSRPAMEAPCHRVDPNQTIPSQPFAHASTFLLCALQTSLWLGAWYDPFGLIAYLEINSHDTGIGPAVTNPAIAILANFLGILVFLAKALFLLALQNALARHLPRYRLDELFHAVHVLLLPASILNLLAAAAYLWLTEPLLKFQNITQITLAAIGILMLPVFAWMVLHAQLSKRRSALGH